MHLLKSLLAIVVVLALAIIVMRALHPLPPRPSDQATLAIPPDTETRIGAALGPITAEHEGLSGIVPLGNSHDALFARALLLRAAEATIDIQYYIWQANTTGWILLDEVRGAAERGVRVRLLLDDNGIHGLDNVLSGLNSLPEVEVRIFNPFTLRTPKLLSFAFDFPRLNRRMHNKSLTVDGLATIVGGRNIGDSYFAFGDGMYFFDLDVLAVGPAAEDVSTDFDAYWSSGSAYAAEDILPASEDGLAELKAAGSKARASASGSGYMAAISASPLVEDVLSGTYSMEWSATTLVSDDPSKGLGKASGDELLLGKLPGLVERPQHSIDLVSAYLIPGTEGMKLLESYLGDGIKTRLMTNSLEATDVSMVHGAWMKYRTKLLSAGAEILELRAQPDVPDSPLLARLLSRSLSSLHAKTFAVDGERIFIGSFNFDPRSAELNTEMGLLIESPELANNLARAFDRKDGVYQVNFAPNGGLEWIETNAAGEVTTYTAEPRTNILQRTIVRILSWLPVEWLL